MKGAQRKVIILLLSRMVLIFIYMSTIFTIFKVYDTGDYVHQFNMEKHKYLFLFL